MRCFPRRVFLLIPVGVIVLLSAAFSVHKLTQGSWQTGLPTWTMDLNILIEPSALREGNDVIMCVTSAPSNIEKRQAIRDTWATTRNLQTVFFMGIPGGPQAIELQKQIDREKARYDDIVQIAFNEDYRNLTLKSVALVLWTVQRRWPRRRLVIKADDDTFVNTPLLFNHSNQFVDGEMYGAYRHQSMVLRCEQSRCNKWGLTKEEYNPDVFPPHLQGAFYVITENALNRLHKYLFEPAYIFIEDVYLTGLVANRAGVSRSGMPNKMWISPYWPNPSTPAELKKNLVAQHYCSPTLQKKYWKHVTKQK